MMRGDNTAHLQNYYNAQGVKEKMYVADVKRRESGRILGNLLKLYWFGQIFLT